MGNTAATATTSSQQDTAPLPSDCLVVKLREADMVDGRGRTKPYSKGTVVEIGYDGIIDNECAKKGDREKHYYDDSNPPPENANILLHSCCAPCSGAMFEEMLKQKYNITIFFYNPNIHPRKEYEIRKEENKRYARKHKVPFVDCDYDAHSWFQRMKGLEHDPERIGSRCVACFDMRMEVTAHYAATHGFHCFTTTNATSRWKDESQVDGAGLRAARDAAAAGHQVSPKFWLRRWKTDALTKRKYEISAEERFYKQEYCGCSYSLRDSNTWRKQNGIPQVRIGGEIAGLGTRYFEDPEVDAEEESQEVVDAFFKAAEGNFKEGTSKKCKEGGRSDVVTTLNAVYGQRKKETGGASLSMNNW
jgi:epoxyqueuosine reductase